MAHKLGVTSAADLQSYPPESLGGLGRGVTPLEMADVYATLASGGYRNKPIAITKVVFPDGRVDSSWGKPQRTRALSPAVDAEETKILHENVLQGTATRSAVECPKRPPRRGRRPTSSTPGWTATRAITPRPSGWATRTRTPP